jgi:hypothetical protein
MTEAWWLADMALPRTSSSRGAGWWPRGLLTAAGSGAQRRLYARLHCSPADRGRSDGHLVLRTAPAPREPGALVPGSSAVTGAVSIKNGTPNFGRTSFARLSNSHHTYSINKRELILDRERVGERG